MSCHIRKSACTSPLLWSSYLLIQVVNTNKKVMNMNTSHQSKIRQALNGVCDLASHGACMNKLLVACKTLLWVVHSASTGADRDGATHSEAVTYLGTLCCIRS